MRLPKLPLCSVFFLCALSTIAHANDVDIPLTKLGTKTGPTLKFYYCRSCGYRKVFEDFVNILQQKYPELHIYGENYNPPGYNMFIAKLLGVSKALIMALMLKGVNIFQWVGLPQPYWWQWCTNNRLFACLMLFYLSNAIEGQLVSSGAFEILLNDVPVWSKLEIGRIPQVSELFQIIDNHMRMLFQDVDVGKINFNK
ncbi:thioredoxin reductase-like selenoprotein T homolog CG3887 [Orussus abietinus]|uniref:thioredoxin reductase-like selenoprotein T homolog CG3887 n=1 Tax=Orussus abietinus TaxID=222816 RepID=UPI000625E97A|nr:thioredoxin reductase-like selenoprotein T homolog CG3887 [Orussus abietinus]